MQCPVLFICRSKAKLHRIHMICFSQLCFQCADHPAGAAPAPVIRCHIQGNHMKTPCIRITDKCTAGSPVTGKTDRREWFSPLQCLACLRQHQRLKPRKLFFTDPAKL